MEGVVKSYHKGMRIKEGVEIVDIFVVGYITTLRNCQYFVKLSTCIPFDPVTAFLGIYLKDTAI